MRDQFGLIRKVHELIPPVFKRERGRPATTGYNRQVFNCGVNKVNQEDGYVLLDEITLTWPLPARPLSAVPAS